ncbi:MAG: hypothetical protein DRR19_32040 [Candidatus Parabeggiatoa sp. nov. 1]|nr:MAG: hypothetical protein DRR19_32040 [Gammaproteobacteria bacterium]
MYKLVFLSLFVLFLTACDERSDVATLANNEPSPPPSPYSPPDFVNFRNDLVWEDSFNNEDVSDATGEFVQFEAGTGYMQFGSTTYTNAWVDEENGDFYLDGEWLGGVAIVQDTNGDPIAALVARDDTLIDIAGTEYNLVVDNNTDLGVVFASYNTASLQVPPVETAATQHKLAVHSSTTAESESVDKPASQKLLRSFPMYKSNAIVGSDSEYPQMGILLKKQ